MIDPTLYLKDILEAMEAIERFVEGMEFEDFKMDGKASSAAIRKFEKCETNSFIFTEESDCR